MTTSRWHDFTVKYFIQQCKQSGVSKTDFYSKRKQKTWWNKVEKLLFTTIKKKKIMSVTLWALWPSVFYLFTELLAPAQLKNNWILICFCLSVDWQNTVKCQLAFFHHFFLSLARIKAKKKKRWNDIKNNVTFREKWIKN